MRRVVGSALLLGVTVLGLGGCSAPRSPSGGITVFAAASLAQAFTELGDQFTASDPAEAVSFSFAGSADLITQLTNGAPADVLATADAATMQKAVESGVATTPVALATNTLTIAVAPGNPLGVRGFADLAATTVVTCAPQVPCGAAVVTIERLTGITLSPVSQENSVTDVLNKVRTGQVDAGLVYRTDARAAGGAVATVDFPEAAEAVNGYRIAVTTGAANRDSARRFIELATGPHGRAVLTRLGFGDP